jgi:uncharacterized RDD family membrane protein YckC
VYQPFATPVYVGFWYRFLAYLIDTLISFCVFFPLGFIGFIMIAFTEQKQGLHDILAGTLVLRGTGPQVAYPEPSPPPDFGGGQFGGRY